MFNACPNITFFKNYGQEEKLLETQEQKEHFHITSFENYDNN